MAPMGPFCKPRVFTRGYDYVGKRLHTFCTPFAHLPESGAFLRKVCTACFPLHKRSLVGARPLHLAGARPFGHSKAPLGLLLLRKRESFMQTELSSILCVRLRPSAGWLQGSPYRRFLLPSAFHFAGAGVLPGSGLARSSPGIPCRRSCGFRGATGKTATKKPSQNRSALPSLFLEGHASRLC